MWGIRSGGRGKETPSLRIFDWWTGGIAAENAVGDPGGIRIHAILAFEEIPPPIDRVFRKMVRITLSLC
jgi:hypothetical protein